MFGPKIKLDRDLYRRLTRIAEIAGYSSTEEFILHLLEEAAASGEAANSEEEIKQRLQGLGYLD
jgi:metal-responsive CopG/Arc/MetJ family transcriptional regulator